MQRYTERYFKCAKDYAQSQLVGRNHYVDNQTLKFHHAKILHCGIHAEGLLFWLIESVGLDFENSKRGFRFVIFDVFGNVVVRPDLDTCASTSQIAMTRLQTELAKIDAKQITIEAAKRNQQNLESFLVELG